MYLPRPQLATRSPAQGAFTLLEMVVVIAIIITILAAAMPLTSGLQQEKELRDGTVGVQQFAREARRLSVQDGETIDLIFTAREITFNRPNRVPVPEGEEAVDDPTLNRGSVRGRRPGFSLQRQSEEELLAAVDAPPPPDPKPYTLPAGLEFFMYSVEKKKWLPVSGWRWRFQPSGLCDPLEVRVYRGEAWMGMRFAPLTAGVAEESYYLP